MYNFRNLISRKQALLFFILIIINILTGCSSPPPATVSDRGQPPTRKILTHQVGSNDTLYSIAWRYGLDYRKLARHNAIIAPYTIFKHQKIRLDIHNPDMRKPMPVRKVVRAKAPPKARPQPVKRTQTVVKRPVKTPAKITRSTPPKPQRSVNRATPPTQPKAASGTARWQWPTKGRVLAGYTSNKGLNKGIDIGGNLGQPVVAAAGGQVVYAGTGLRGYGKLLIIKHNNIFLSAYAHNRVLMVKEGESVKAGQKIAEMGSSGTDTIKLHFEIRKDGKSVNPLRHLPK